MRKLALRVFDYSLDGIIGEDDTDGTAGLIYRPLRRP